MGNREHVQNPEAVAVHCIYLEDGMVELFLELDCMSQGKPRCIDIGFN